MKKLYRLTTVAAFSLALATVLLTGCKKDDSTTTAADAPTADELARGEATLAKIMDFKQRMDYYKANPAIKDGETVTLDEAIWNIEALFNVTYSYPELSYGRTVTADTILYLPLQADNTVLLTELTVFYGQMYEVISDIYHGIDLDNKQFIILDVEEGAPAGDHLPVTLHSVQGAVKGTPPPIPEPQMWMPFAEGISWYYGEDGGNNMGIYPNNIDAADTLTRLLNATLVSKAPHGFSYYYTSTVTKELRNDDHHEYTNSHYPNCGPYSEFYKENPTAEEKWMNSDMMNFHYFGEKQLIMYYLRDYGIESVPSSHHLCNVTIQDNNNKTSNKIWHHTQATYGHRDVVGEHVVERGNL